VQMRCKSGGAGPRLHADLQGARARWL
jgi:hypothetical protein